MVSVTFLLCCIPVNFFHIFNNALCNFLYLKITIYHKRFLLFKPEKGGIVMINFFPRYITCKENASISDVAGEKVTSILRCQAYVNFRSLNLASVSQRREAIIFTVH